MGSEDDERRRARGAVRDTGAHEQPSSPGRITGTRSVGPRSASSSRSLAASVDEVRCKLVVLDRAHRARDPDAERSGLAGPTAPPNDAQVEDVSSAAFQATSKRRCLHRDVACVVGEAVTAVVRNSRRIGNPHWVRLFCDTPRRERSRSVTRARRVSSTHRRHALCVGRCDALPTRNRAFDGREREPRGWSMRWSCRATSW
jgi:hypothetical protein